jgi:hypothetical protein
MYVGGYLFLYYFWRLTCVVSKDEKYLLAKRMGLLLLSCSFPALFISSCIVLFFFVVFLFYTCLIPICCLGFFFFLFL